MSQSSFVSTYRRGENPSALIVYASRSESLGAAMCDKLLSYGFYVVVVAIDSSQKGSLRHYPDNQYSWFTVNANGSEETLLLISEDIRARNFTVAISCVDAGVWTGLNPVSNEICYPSALFVEIQRTILSNLVSHTPAALLLVSSSSTQSRGSRSSSVNLDDTRFLSSFASALTREIQSLGYDGVQVTYMDYYDVAKASGGTIFAPSPELLCDSIIRSVGHNATHITPYWPHEILSWIVWTLLWLFPQSVVRRLVP